MLRRLALVGAVCISLLPLTARADVPWPSSSGQPNPYAYQNYLRAPVDCNAAVTNAPNDLDCNDWHRSGKRDPQLTSAQELGGVIGPTVDKAWDVSTGRPDIHIAVLDSGIMWDDAGAMREVRNKVALNWAELPPPEIDAAHHTSCARVVLPSRTRKLASPGFPTCYDRDHNGVFNVDDYAADPRVNPAPKVAGGTHPYFCPACGLTPEDLIQVFSCYDNGNAAEPVGQFVNVTPTGPRQCDNGAERVDNDGNGFPHDIAGWNFMERTNDPFDEPHYGHGTGEAKDSTAEANNGGEVGICPSCMVVPLKVGDSFIADVNDFAQAVLYATDNGVNVVQEALGTLNNSALNQAAIDYAYGHGVTIIASAADEAAGHHNQPGSSENHMLVVNSIRANEVPSLGPVGKTYLMLNGCTNYGGHTILAVPSASCSSEATGRSSGMAGLVYSTARNLVKQGKLRRYAPPSAGFPDGIDISPNEVKQVLASTADDINFEDAAGARRGDSLADPGAACSPVTTDPAGAPDNYGSTNAGENYHSIAGWDQYFGYGRVNASCAVRAVLSRRIPPEVEINTPLWWSNLDTVQNQKFTIGGRVAASRASSFTYRVEIGYGVQPHEDNWTTVYTSPAQHGPVSGTLATISAVELNAIMSSPVPHPHSINENGDQTDWLAPPYTLPGHRGNQWDEYTFTVRVRATDSANLTGEDRKTLQSHHDSGFGGNGDPVTGFPKQLDSDGASSPLMADLLGDNQNELIFGTSSGLVHAMRVDGTEPPGWPVHVSSICASMLPDDTGPCLQHQREPAFHDARLGAVAQRSYSAILGSVAVGDLDRTGKLEVVAVDASGYVYVFEKDGSLRPGFPVHENYAFSRQGVPGHFNRDHDNRVQFGFVAAPTLADLDNSGRLEIILGALDRHVYVFEPDGSARPGFPVILASPEYVAAIDPGTDRVHLKTAVAYGTKIVSSPAVGDLLGDGRKEIILGRNEEYDKDTPGEGGVNASADTVPPAIALLNQKLPPDNRSVVNSGNGRVYALYGDGTLHASQSCNASGPVPTNAYVCGWPTKVMKALLELLPYVGSGVDTPPSLAPFPCPQNNSPGLRVAVFASDGPVYIFGSDGKSCYGQAPDKNGNLKDRVLGSAISNGDFTDVPFLPAVGIGAFGDLSGNGDLVLATATAGIEKTLDVALAAHQYNAQNSITAWRLTGVAPGTVPQPHPGFPHYMNDLQVLAGPAIADLTGLGPQEIIEGSATSDVRAATPAGADLPGWSKNTGGWTVDTPAVATVGADRHQKVATLTREGGLYLWQSTAPACAGASWPRYKHDIWNSGNYTTGAGRPAAITDLRQAQSGTTVTLQFTAPNGNLFCGDAQGYEVRYSTSGPITNATRAAATPVPTGAGPGCRASGLGAKPAGQAETITLTGCPRGTLWFGVQAFNGASRAGGNLGAISSYGRASAPPAAPLPLLLLLTGGIASANQVRKVGRRKPAAG
jgi:hypothetical protein